MDFLHAAEALAAAEGPDLSKAIDPSGLSLVNWSVAAAVLVGGVVLSLLARRSVVSVLRRGTSSHTFAEVLVGRLVQATVIVLAGVYALTALGVQFAPLLGALGIGGIAVALALQPTLENLFAGVVLHAQRPFRLGDEVITSDVRGEVIDITSRAVVIRRNSGEIVYIPNSTVLDREIENLVRHGRRRSTLVVGVAYATDLGRAREVIQAATAGCAAVLERPAPLVLAMEFDDSSVNFQVDFWHRPREAERRKARDEVVEAIHVALRAAGITIPFPQRTVWFADHRDDEERPTPGGERGD